MLVFPHGVPVPISAPLPLIQLPANVPGKVTKDGTNSWIPATYVGYPDGVPGSWIRPVPTLVVVGMWAVNLGVFFVSLFIYFILLSSKKINKS